MTSRLVIMTMLAFLNADFALAQDGNPLAPGSQQNLQNTWILIKQDCNLELSTAEIRALTQNPQAPLNYNSILTLSDNQYSLRTVRSPLCLPNESRARYNPDGTLSVYCGDELLTQGTFSKLAGRAAFFVGKVIQSSEGLFEGLGVNQRDVDLFLDNSILVLRETNKYQCRSGRLTSYFIPVPVG